MVALTVTLSTNIQSPLARQPIGYGLRSDDPRELATKKAFDVSLLEPIGFEAYAAFVKDYDLERVSNLSGVETGFLEEHFCGREFAINHKLAPQLYKRVIAIKRSPEGLHLRSSGKWSNGPFTFAVSMKTGLWTGWRMQESSIRRLSATSLLWFPKRMPPQRWSGTDMRRRPWKASC